jgi:CheY-like chemotaxis protein
MRFRYRSEGMAHRHGVLVVEDDFGTREAFVELARLRDLDAVGASNGRDALARLGAGFRPCLIVLDLAMPEMDGFEFRAAQLADPAIADIPVAVMTGGGWAVEADARKIGLVRFLRKPVDIDELLRLFETHCGGGDRAP